MADETNNPESKEETASSPSNENKADKKLTLEEYALVKAKRIKERTKTKMPWFIYLILFIPLVVVVTLLMVYIFYAKDLPIR